MGLLEWSGDRALRHAATAALFLNVFKGFFHGYFVRTFLSVGRVSRSRRGFSDACQ
jgi:hypothetical protein